MKKFMAFLVLAFLLPSAIPYAETVQVESLVIERYRKALESDPGNAEVRLQLSIAYLKEKFYDRALDHLLVLRKSMADDPDINYYLGIAHAGNGEPDEAFAAYSAVERLSPQRAVPFYELDKVFYNLGISYQRDGVLEAALAAYSKSVQLNGRTALPYCRMGEVYFELKDYDQALENLSACEQKSPGESRVRRHIASARLARGLSLTGEGRYEEALVDFRKASELDPENESAVYFTGYVHFKLLDFRQAQAVLEKLDKPESPEIIENLPALLQNIGIELQKRGDWEKAEKALGQAVTLRRKSPDLHYLLGVNHENTGDYAGAASYLKEALVLAPEHQKAKVALAVVTEKLIEGHIRRGDEALAARDYERALHSFDLALQMDPVNMRAANGAKEAESHLKATKHEVLKKRAEEVASKLGTANKYLRQEKYIEAIAAYRYILAFDPANEAAAEGLESADRLAKEKTERHRLAGDRYAKEGNLQMALLEYRKAFGYDPGNPAVQAGIKAAEEELRARVKALMDKGVQYESRNNHAEAVRAYNEALKLMPESSEALEARTRAAASVRKVEAAKAPKPAKADFEKLYFEGIELYTEGKYVEAIKRWERVIEHDPGHERARQNIDRAKKKLEGVMNVK